MRSLAGKGLQNDWHLKNVTTNHFEQSATWTRRNPFTFARSLAGKGLTLERSWVEASSGKRYLPEICDYRSSWAVRPLHQEKSSCTFWEVCKGKDKKWLMLGWFFNLNEILAWNSDYRSLLAVSILHQEKSTCSFWGFCLEKFWKRLTLERSWIEFLLMILWIFGPS